MNDRPRDPVRDQVRRVVRDLNAAWREGRFDNLGAFFHENAVMVAPGFQARLEGRSACVESYREFCANARVHEVELAEPDVDLFRETAVVSCAFRMRYELQGRSYDEGGRDVLVLQKEGDHWFVVWRTLVSSEAGPTAP